MESCFNTKKFLVAFETPNMGLDTPEMQYIINHRMCNAFDWWPFLTDEQMAFLEKNPHYGLCLFMPTDMKRLENFHERTSVGRRIIPEQSFIDQEVAKLEKLSPILGGNVWWDVLPEYNSSDDAFYHFAAENGLKFTSRKEAHDAIALYVNSQPALASHLARDGQKVKLMAVAGGATSAPYMFEWGMDIGLVEICVDSCPDIHPVVAILRGAARQYDKEWGLDISHWRIMFGPTMYDKNMQRVSGWSEGYLERNMFAAYMSGANLLRVEEVVSRGEPTPTGEAGMNCGFIVDESGENAQTTPLGDMLERYADFTLHKGIDRGETYVPVALMLDYEHGWQPRHAFDNTRSLWFGQLPYEDGDYMIDNVMDMFYPGHHRSGGVDGAPFAIPEDYNYSYWEGSKRRKHIALYQNMLSEGLDTRPYEVISSAVYGDSFDCLLSNARYETLKKYKALILLGQVNVDEALARDIERYVSEGGILVANVKQMGCLDPTIFGVTLTDQVKSDNSSRCLRCDKHFGEKFNDGNNEEPWYDYTLVAPNAAEVLAKTDSGDALITENAYGSGRAVLVTPHYASGKGVRKTVLVRVVRDYLEHLMETLTVVEFEGKRDLSYIVNITPDGYLLMLMNNLAYEWEGQIAVRLGSTQRPKVRALYGESPAECHFSDGKLVLGDKLNEYSFKIYEITC